MVVVTRGDEVRADGLHRNGALRITIACTGVAAARFSLCLHVKSRHLGDAYRYPTEPRTFAAFLAPCGAHPTLETRPPTLHCPQRPTNTQAQTALRGINRRPNSNAQSMLKCRMHCVAPTNACPWLLDSILLDETCFADDTLLLFSHGDCHPRGRSPR
ncbi:hypothetical protein LF1_54420 [Rubripirellula obstinata]|uniref:Uncharacterized protein n=1 Tax=Rubripirellula obstinata TaxID=406547 RepID=A0A5B1CD20_9BACT|nr:hypothetical protein LF1_54420 [Rubripirellula obstinata]